MITDNKCIMDGKYLNGNTIINIINSSLVYNDNDQTIRLYNNNNTVNIIYNDFVVYRDCMTIKNSNTGLIFTRIIGNECDNSNYNNNYVCVYGFNHKIIFCQGNNIIVNNRCIPIIISNTNNSTKTNNSNNTICPQGYYINNTLCTKNISSAPIYLCENGYKFYDSKCVKQLYIEIAIIYSLVGLIIGVICSIIVYIVIKRIRLKCVQE